MIVQCECGAKLRFDDAKVQNKRVKVRCPRCGNLLAVQKQPADLAGSQPVAPAVLLPSEAPLVIVAHDSEVVRVMISQVLRDAGFSVDIACDGHEALRKAVNARPQAMVVDVGLSGIYGFDLCERLKSNTLTSAIKIVLCSSVYDKKRYKRKPVSLYGADDYIEKHHIPDSLPGKIRNLIKPPERGNSKTPVTPHDVSPSPPSREFGLATSGSERFLQKEPECTAVDALGSAGGPMAEPVEMLRRVAAAPEALNLESSIFQQDECGIQSMSATDPETEEKARRFARIIVSDIALYNQDAVAEGLKNGTFYDLLRNDISEGRELYEKRVPAVVRIKNDFYQEAFDNFIKTQKKIVR